jgi:hypothetical protein
MRVRTVASGKHKPGHLMGLMPQKYCSRACANYARQPDGPKGYIHHSGYRYFNVAGGKRGAAIAEHKMVMEQMLGRPLRKDETIHHKNGRRDDNRPENLELWSGRHGKGHRVADQVEFAKETIKIYGEGPFDASFIERGKADLAAMFPELGIQLSH